MCHGTAQYTLLSTLSGKEFTQYSIWLFHTQFLIKSRFGSGLVGIRHVPDGLEWKMPVLSVCWLSVVICRRFSKMEKWENGNQRQVDTWCLPGSYPKAVFSAATVGRAWPIPSLGSFCPWHRSGMTTGLLNSFVVLILLKELKHELQIFDYFLVGLIACNSCCWCKVKEQCSINLPLCWFVMNLYVWKTMTFKQSPFFWQNHI